MHMLLEYIQQINAARSGMPRAAEESGKRNWFDGTWVATLQVAVSFW
jgi:hypothetical protein